MDLASAATIADSAAANHHVTLLDYAESETFSAAKVRDPWQVSNDNLT